MDLKPQDLLVLLKVAAHPPQRWTYVALGDALSMSSSEAHASVKRAVASGLAVAASRAEWSPIRPNLLEFMLHGVRYIWPAAAGPVKRGVPTAFGAEPLASQLTAAPGEAPVWAHPEGKAKGRRFHRFIARLRKLLWPIHRCIACWRCSMPYASVGLASAGWPPNYWRPN